jgi:hypothetical protein
VGVVVVCGFASIGIMFRCFKAGSVRIHPARSMASRRAATALVLAREKWIRISWMVGEYPYCFL